MLLHSVPRRDYLTRQPNLRRVGACAHAAAKRKPLIIADVRESDVYLSVGPPDRDDVRSELVIRSFTPGGPNWLASSTWNLVS